MFDAARAALLALSEGFAKDTWRTHRGLIAAFGTHMVKSGKVSAELGRSLNRLHEIRMIADYSSNLIDASLARRSVEEAVQFVEAMRRFVIGPGTPDA
jgi:uncharacterized protein (UPF0332 family)